MEGGLVQAAGAEQVSPAAQVMLPADGELWAGAGRGLKAAPELAAKCRSAGAVVFDDLLPRAREILALARPEVSEGRILPAEKALPVYVRDRVVSVGPS